MKEMRQEFADTLIEVGKVDKNLIVLVGDISHFRLLPFSAACPGRYYNVGICEPTIVNMAAGLSMLGFYPVVHTIAPFIVERSYEQIKLDFCYQKLGVNIVTVGSAFDYSTLGCTHHCYVDFALLRPLPGVQIFFPASPIEFNTLFRQSYNNNLVSYFRIPKSTHDFVFTPGVLTAGKGIRVRQGEDVTIVVTGPQLKTALEAADYLKKDGCSADVLYLHTIKPFDWQLVCKCAKNTKRIITIEEHSLHGGLCDEVLRATRDIDGLRHSFIAIPDMLVRDYGSYADMCELLGFTSANIVQKIKSELF